MNYLVQRLTAIELFPIRALILYCPPDFKNFTNVESESSWSLRPITRTDGFGASRTVAWRAEAKIYLPHFIAASFGENEAATDIPLLRELKDISRRDSADVQLILGDHPFIGNWHGADPTPYNYTAGAMVDFGLCNFSFEVESAEFRARSIITIGRTAKTVTVGVDAAQDYADADTIFISHYSGG